MESVRAILDGLTWLGLDWDEGPGMGGPHEPYFQSERKELYRREVERLIAEGKAYRCYCTKEELDAQREALKARDPKAQFVYPGTCRGKPDQPEVPHAVRFMSPKEGATTFVDKVFGAISTPNAQQQDFVLIRPSGLPLYNTAAVIDDHVMGITLVARGRDHIGNTPQQVLLYEALGYELPEFAHLPMMLSAKGEKLSKRHASVAVMEYKEKGYTPAGVLNYLARFGWSYGDQEIFSLDELIEKFDWERVNKSDGKFDEKKFADVAFEHLKNPALTDDASYVQGVVPEILARGIAEPSEAHILLALPLIRERARDFKDAAAHLDFYFRSPPVMEEKAGRLLTNPAAKPLRDLAQAIESSSDFSVAGLEQTFQAELDRSGIKMKDLAQPVRAALTGRTASPGLFEVMVVLGKDESCRRLRAAALVAEKQS